MSEASPMDSLIADFRVSMKRLKEHPLASPEEVSRELQLNVYPSLIALAEQIAEVDEVVLELSEQGDSYLQSDLAKQIFQTIALGAAVIDEARKILVLVDDDLARKRIKDLLDSFEHSIELTVMGVNDAVVDDDDDDGGDKSDEDEEEDDDEETEPGKKKADVIEGEKQ